MRDNPSPYIEEKILLSKRLNQCINPILPDPIHLEVLNIHEQLFLNIRANSDNNINEYIRLFAEDLGTFPSYARYLLTINSASLRPHFQSRPPTEDSEDA